MSEKELAKAKKKAESKTDKDSKAKVTEQGKKESKQNDSSDQTQTPRRPTGMPSAQAQAPISKFLEKDKDKGAESSESIEVMLKSMQAKMDNMLTPEHLKTSLKKLITEDMLTTNLEKLRVDLKDNFKREIEKVHEKVSDLEVRYTASEKIVTELRNKVSDLETKVDNLEDENVNLKRDRDKILDRLEATEYAIKVNTTHTNDLEQYTRRNNIRIYGMEDRNKDETSHETTTAVINFCQKHLGVSLGRSDIDIAHRMGRYLDSGNRVVICRFVSRMDRDHVIKLRSKLKGTRYVIRDDLTNRNAKLLETASDVANVDCLERPGKNHSKT